MGGKAGEMALMSEAYEELREFRVREVLFNIDFPTLIDRLLG